MAEKDGKKDLTRKQEKKEVMQFIDKTFRSGNTNITQPQLVELLSEEEGISIGQSTISKYLKELGYEKHGDDYVKTREKDTIELETILIRVLVYANPTFKLVHGKSLSTLYIFTKERLEDSIAELISLRYREGGISGITAGKGCVSIYLESKELGEKLLKALEKRASRLV